jgi:hypothetical protein
MGAHLGRPNPTFHHGSTILCDAPGTTPSLKCAIRLGQAMALRKGILIKARTWPNDLFRPGKAAMQPAAGRGRENIWNLGKC